jgi:uncharacterized membrane protein YfhO
MEKDMKRKKNISSKEHEKIMYCLAFFIPIFAMIIIYIIRGIYPYGDNMYLRSDMYHQYAPFFQELANKIKNGGSLTYTWDVGMGMNFTALAAYYLASPINVILGFFTGSHMIEVMSALIIIKMGLSSFTMAWYLSKHFHKKTMITAAFGVFYGLSSYFCAYSWNLMWLDCMWLLPLIVYGIEKIVAEKKYKLYCLSLALAIFSNYYIAIMLCIFSVIYFIYCIITSEGENRLLLFLKRGLLFGGFSLLAGGMAACLVLPEYNALMLTASGDFDFPDTLSNYFSIFDMVSRSLMNVDVAIFEPHDPNLYCTVLVFFFVPLYWMASKVPIKQRVGKTVILVIFLLSFNMNIPNYIWHGFHFPNSLPCRESFIYIFVILTMCYEAFVHIKSFSNKQIYSAFGGAAALLLIIEKLYVSDDYDFMIVYLSLAFLAVYLFWVTLCRNPKVQRALCVYIFLIVAVAEAFINANETGFSTTSRSYYVKDNEAISELVETATEDAEADNNLFWRMEKYERRTKNDQAWHQYRGMSTFSSTVVKAVGDLYSELGLQQSYNSYAFYGATPLTQSLFSVQYTLSNTIREEYPYEELIDEAVVESDEIENVDASEVYLYKNTYTLPLGFMTYENSLEDWANEDTDSNPFSVQNSFAAYTAGVEELFTPLSCTAESGDLWVNVEEDSDVYIYVSSSGTEKVVASVYDSEGAYSRGETFKNTNHKYICHVGNVAGGNSIKLYAENSDGESVSIQAYAYAFDNDKMEEVYNVLSEGGLELTTFEDTELEGTVTAKEDGTLYTSISYEEGWTAYVDGEEVETSGLKDALLTIQVPAGTHTVRFEYSPKGLTAGIIISILSILIFVGAAVFEWQWKKKKALQFQGDCSILGKE